MAPYQNARRNGVVRGLRSITRRLLSRITSRRDRENRMGTPVARINQVALVALLSLLVAATAHASLYSWTGSSDALWSNANNWSPIGVPASGDTLAFPSAASNLTN